MIHKTHSANSRDEWRTSSILYRKRRLDLETLNLRNLPRVIKVKLHLCLTKYHAMKMYGEVEV